MKITYEEKSNKFIISCDYADNGVVLAMPDRRFRKGSRTWGAPALRRNLEYMRKCMDKPEWYDETALEVLRRPLKTPKEAQDRFPGWFKFKNPPMPHQKVAMDKAYALTEYALLFEQGLGKTFTAINLAAAWRMEGKIDAVIVVCPSSIKLVWEEELEKHCPLPTQIHALMAGKKKQVEAFIAADMDFPWFIVGVEAISTGGAHEYLSRFLMSRRCLMVIDESSRIKTPGKTRTDRCVAFGLNATKRMILSGTPVTQGIEDLYTQYRFLDPNIIGFDSYYTFRANYCILQNIEVAQNKSVTKIVGYQNEDELLKSIGPCTSRVEKKDALDLPEKTYQNRYVSMTKLQQKLYVEMKHEMMLEVGPGIEYEASTVMEKGLRLSQITGGFYPHDDGETVVATPIPGKNPKVEETKLLMEEVAGKIVVWCQFRCEIAAVYAALQAEDIGVQQFHGGCSDEEKRKAVFNFRKAQGVKVFLATRAAAYGLTLTESSTAIYYSLGHSLDIYEQSQDRLHRIGQIDPCLYIHLVCPGTIDIKVIAALRDKKAVATVVYDALKEGSL